MYEKHHKEKKTDKTYKKSVLESSKLHFLLSFHVEAKLAILFNYF